MTKKKQKVTSPSFTTAHLKKVLIQRRYVQLPNIKALFTLNSDQEKTILSKIMKLFWKGEHNLFCVPELSELCRFKSEGVIVHGEKGCPAQTITREVFRDNLIPFINGKKRRLKRPDRISNRFEIVDAEDDFYKTFQKETWEFYHRIFSRLKREYCKIAPEVKGIKNPDEQLSELYKKFGQPLCKHNHDCNPCDLMLKLGMAEWYLLLRFSSLCVEYRDLVKILIENCKGIPTTTQKCFSKRTLVDIKNSLKEWDSKHDRDLVKSGYDLDNDFIFNRYLDLKNGDSNLTETQISEQLYKSCKEATTMPKENRIRRIIHEKKSRTIQEHFPLWLKNGSEKTNIIKLAHHLFTTSKHIEKIFK